MPKIVILSSSRGCLLTPMLVLLLTFLCTTKSSAQSPTLNYLAYATVMNDNSSQATLHLDLWQSTADSGPAPLVIWIHGGAWLGGTFNSPPPALQSLLQCG